MSDKNGKLLNPKQLNINFRFHTLRHTLAPRLVNNGANIKTTQEILRHSNITNTMNIYTHIDEKSKEKALYMAFPLKNK